MMFVLFFPFQNLCINPEVVRLGNVQMMNDRCLEMQKNKHGQKRKLSVCQFKRSGVAVLNDTLITLSRETDRNHFTIMSVEHRCDLHLQRNEKSRQTLSRSVAAVLPRRRAPSRVLRIWCQWGTRCWWRCETWNSFYSTGERQTHVLITARGCLYLQLR